MGNFVVTEGISGYYHYHLSKEHETTRSLCGVKVMPTCVPLTAWGFVGHLREHWCEKCKPKKKSK